VKVLENSLSKLPVWQDAILAVVVMLSIGAAMFWCCFYGLDSDDVTIAAANPVAQSQQKIATTKQQSVEGE
jgi:hypothetical protein